MAPWDLPLDPPLVSQGGDKGSIIIVITEAAIFKLEVLSASSSEVCLLCFFAVYSFRVFLRR